MRKDYKSYYDNYSYDLVSELYDKDFKKFNYNF
jgi:hypothetical protein